MTRQDFIHGGCGAHKSIESILQAWSRINGIQQHEAWRNIRSISGSRIEISPLCVSVQCAISFDCHWGPDEKTECRGREANVDNWGIFSSDTSLQALQRQVLWEELQREMYFVIVYRLYRLNTDPISRSVVHWMALEKISISTFQTRSQAPPVWNYDLGKPGPPKSDDFFLFPNWGRPKKMPDNFLDRKWPPHTHTHLWFSYLLSSFTWVDLSRTHSVLRGSLCLANIHHILGWSSKSSKEL